MVEIIAITHLGEGKTAEGEFVPRVLPGEQVELTADGARIIEPSSDRVSPPCRHFKSCGGCAMQHASDSFVANWKSDVVRRALSARQIEHEIAEVLTSAPNTRRRAKFSARRTKKGTLIGFHARASDTVVEVPDCKLITPGLKSTLAALDGLTRLAASRKGEVGLTVTESIDGPDVHVDTAKDLTEELRVDLAAWANEAGVARLVWNDEPVVVIRPPRQDFGGTLVVPPPGAFLQATKDGETALQSVVLDIVKGASTVVDLFAGSGTFTLPLSKHAEVHAVEGLDTMMEALDRAWRSGTGLKKVTTETRDLFRRPLLPDEIDRYDAVVIDPPRAGAEAQIAEIAASGVKTVAMVSCNPITFARDAETLIQAGFTLAPIAVVDQFRWSTHIEIVGGFTR